MDRRLQRHLLAPSKNRRNKWRLSIFPKCVYPQRASEANSLESLKRRRTIDNDDKLKGEKGQVEIRGLRSIGRQQTSGPPPPPPSRTHTRKINGKSSSKRFQFHKRFYGISIKWTDKTCAAHTFQKCWRGGGKRPFQAPQ